jgi:Domain of unknown function (DUF3842)
MRVCVMDGQGGGIGGQLIQRLRDVVGASDELVGLAINRAAAQTMTKAGATHVTIGEWAILRSIQKADLIIGSLGIVLPGSLSGEVTPEVAMAVLQAHGRKILLPINRHRVEVVGADAPTLGPLIEQTVRRVQALLTSHPATDR